MDFLHIAKNPHCYILNCFLEKAFVKSKTKPRASNECSPNVSLKALHSLQCSIRLCDYWLKSLLCQSHFKFSWNGRRVHLTWCFLRWGQYPAQSRCWDTADALATLSRILLKFLVPHRQTPALTSVYFVSNANFLTFFQGLPWDIWSLVVRSVRSVVRSLIVEVPGVLYLPNPSLANAPAPWSQRKNLWGASHTPKCL